MAVQLEEPMYQILKAQQANIARIETGLVVEGTTGTGEEVILWGPTPDLIRLYDTPTRLVQADAMDAWERIVTLAPLEDNSEARIVHRDDRVYRYIVQFLIRLTVPEQEADHAEMVKGGVKPSNPLALKSHRLIYDWLHVFHDNLLLETADCPQGLVDTASYRLLWDPGIEYPSVMFAAEVTGSLSGS